MRAHAGLPLDESICVYDLAEGLGIEVRFLDIPSVEGMYYWTIESVIVLSSLRPLGRRAFTCAHELGHYSNGDGTSIDQLVEKPQRSSFDPREFAADCFAGALLMPNIAVQRVFSLRGWNIRECTAGQVYVASNYFGVGYSTMVHHMRSGLRVLPDVHAAALLRVGRRKAQAQALGWESQDTVWIVDSHWKGKAIDVEVGDLVFVQGWPALEGRCVAQIRDMRRGRLFRAQDPGIGKFCDPNGWSAYVRVSRRSFVVRSIFRHLEEEDEDGSDDY